MHRYFSLGIQIQCLILCAFRRLLFVSLAILIFLSCKAAETTIWLENANFVRWDSYPDLISPPISVNQRTLRCLLPFPFPNPSPSYVSSSVSDSYAHGLIWRAAAQTIQDLQLVDRSDPSKLVDYKGRSEYDLYAHPPDYNYFSKWQDLPTRSWIGSKYTASRENGFGGTTSVAMQIHGGTFDGKILQLPGFYYYLRPNEIFYPPDISGYATSGAESVFIFAFQWERALTDSKPDYSYVHLISRASVGTSDLSRVPTSKAATDTLAASSAADYITRLSTPFAQVTNSVPESLFYLAGAIPDRLYLYDFAYSQAPFYNSSWNVPKGDGIKPYINQFDAGDTFGLPTRFGKAGGNACGPVSLHMALMVLSRGTLPTIAQVFDNTMEQGLNYRGSPIGNEYKQGFCWARARAWINGDKTYGKGKDFDSEGHPIPVNFTSPILSGLPRVADFDTSEDTKRFPGFWQRIDAALASRPSLSSTPTALVLLRTNLGSRTTPGGGHVILLLGRGHSDLLRDAYKGLQLPARFANTAISGDYYIVADPAGHFFANMFNVKGSNHYGKIATLSAEGNGTNYGGWYAMYPKELLMQCMKKVTTEIDVKNNRIVKTVDSPMMTFMTIGYMAPRPTLRVEQHSPVVMLVTDPLGRSSGVNEDGKVFDEIPGANYSEAFSDEEEDGNTSKMPDGTKSVSVLSPVPGTYKITTVGTDTGEYSLDITSVLSDVSSIRTVTGTTSIGQKIVHEVSLEGAKFGTGAPIVLVAPAEHRVRIGDDVELDVIAGGAVPLAYQWKYGGVPIEGATTSRLSISKIRVAQFGSYSVDITNGLGKASSTAALLTLDTSPVPTLPEITKQPVSIAVGLGRAATFDVVATGTSTMSFQWELNGVPLEGASKASYTVSSVTKADEGGYSVRVVTPAGSVTSDLASLVVLSPFSGAYYGGTALGSSWGMYVRPDSTGVFVGFGGTAATTFVANVTVNTDGTFSSASPSIAGRINGNQVTGQMGSSDQSFTGSLDTGSASLATAAYYKADGLNGAAGTTHVVTGPSGRILAVTITPTGVDSLTGVVNASGILSATSTAGTQEVVTLENSNQSVWVQSTTSGANPVLTSYGGLTEGVSNTTRLANLSVRAASGSGSQVLGMGFVISGSGTKPMLIRGIGPALAPFGVTGYLTNPQLTVFDSSSKPIASNAGWGGSTSLSTAFTQVGAFPLSDPKSADAVLQLNLSAGTYTAQCSGNGNTTGVALVEAYDMGTTATSRLTNVSVRTQVGTGGNILITGFFNPGNGPKQMLIRAIGPSLAQFGVTGVLAKPKLELHTLVNQKDAVIASNSGWGGTQVLADAFGKVGAFALPANSADAALLVLLHPGLVTVQVSGADGGTGVALAEIYELP